MTLDNFFSLPDEGMHYFAVYVNGIRYIVEARTNYLAALKIKHRVGEMAKNENHVLGPFQDLSALLLCVENKEKIMRKMVKTA